MRDVHHSAMLIVNISIRGYVFTDEIVCVFEIACFFRSGTTEFFFEIGQTEFDDRGASVRAGVGQAQAVKLLQ